MDSNLVASVWSSKFCRLIGICGFWSFNKTWMEIIIFLVSLLGWSSYFYFLGYILGWRLSNCLSTGINGICMWSQGILERDWLLSKMIVIQCTKTLEEVEITEGALNWLNGILVVVLYRFGILLKITEVSRSVSLVDRAGYTWHGKYGFSKMPKSTMRD